MDFEWTSSSVVVLSAVVLLLIAVRQARKFPRTKNYPPGPLALPYIGNLLSFGKKPHLTLLEWKEKFGDVYSFYDGRKRIVVLSNFQTLRKVFGDDLTTGRDNISAVRVDKSTSLETGLLSSHGELWRTHRRFALQTLRDLGMGKNWLEDAIIVEVENLCRILLKTNQKPFNPKVPLNNSISNVICALTFGQRFSLTDPKFSRLTGLVSETISSLTSDSLALAFPFLLWFPTSVRSTIHRGRESLRSLATFLTERVREHGGQADAQDYIYAYQTYAENAQRKTVASDDSFDEAQLVASLGDLFMAGTETTSTTTLWAFVFMLENPDVLKKVQEEIDRNVGRDKMLTNSDRSILPYTEAVILEVQRCASLVPLGLPHANSEEMLIEGYTIPKDTLLLGNLFSIHRDPRWWQNPEKFNPDRFLDENMKLIRPDGFVPFSIGKRACLGEALAKMELFLFIANLFRCFDVKLPADKTISREDYTFGIVNSPLSFELIFIPRVGLKQTDLLTNQTDNVQ